MWKRERLSLDLILDSVLGKETWAPYGGTRLPPYRLDIRSLTCVAGVLWIITMWHEWTRMITAQISEDWKITYAQVYWVYLSQEMIIVSSLSFLIRDPYCWGKNIGSSIKNPHVLVFPERQYYHCPMARVQSVLGSFWPIGVKWTLRTHRRWGGFFWKIWNRFTCE